MLLTGLGRAAAVGVIAGVFPLAHAAGQDTEATRGSGGEEPSIVFATIDTEGLANAPRYATGPSMLSERGEGVEGRSQNLVLVPLPAPLWAAASGLTGLALVFAWRRHRLRSQ